VQEAIGRGQSEAQSRTLVQLARTRGFKSINLDLIYGLPLQTEASFAKGIETLLDLRPERIALYSFALVPWKSHQQKRIEEKDLPAPDVKLALFAHALNALTAAGYAQVGMDHFALPTDELAIAQANGRLHRNFQGYTVKPPCDTIGVGISAIGDVQAAYAQNTKSLPAYAKAIAAGAFAVERGIALTPDDVIRRDWITRLMCNFGVDLTAFGSRYKIDPIAYFASEWSELDDFEAEGFLTRAPDRLALTELGRLFVRNVALVFDVHTRRRSGGKRVFSRTV
jgi:oxygen-independent coproporphyrinogen-3 oxidase